jgi:hypothetical protein
VKVVFFHYCNQKLRRYNALLRIFVILPSLCFFLVSCSQHPGKVVEAESGEPIANATVFHNGRVTHSDAQGKFILRGVNFKKPVLVKAAGFRQTSINTGAYQDCTAKLTPFAAKAVYLSHHGIADSNLRKSALQLIEDAHLNAIVIDVKGDRGTLSFDWDLPQAVKAGAMSDRTIGDVKGLIQDLHRKQIYVIGRIVVFKDERLAQLKPQWAVKDAKTGKPFTGADKTVWMDPFQKGVWDYNIDIAKAAAAVGFDEIQFDCVRFPSVSKAIVEFSKKNSPENRVEATSGFLKRARKELSPDNVFISVNIFGITLWNTSDTAIGEKLEELAADVDYLSPRLYPSSFTGSSIPKNEIPNYTGNSAAMPGEIVYYALEHAAGRLGVRRNQLRPWLQNFKDYAFDKREFTAREIALQVYACTKSKTGGYMLWDAANKYQYTAEALKLLEKGSVSDYVSATNQIIVK